MKYLFFVLLLISLVSCIPRIPGSDKVGLGIDGTTLEFKGLPVTSLTWNEFTTTWTNPLYTNATYLVPAELIAQDDVESTLISGSVVFEDAQSYQSQDIHQSGSSGFLGFGEHSKESGKVLEKYYSEDQSIALTYQYHSWYKLTMPPLPPPQLNSKTVSALKLLPSVYENDNTTQSWLQYRNFINFFGTHYLDSAIIGGKLKMTTFFNKCFLSTYSNKWVNKQSGWSFLGIINDHHGSDHNNGETTALWNQYSSSSFELVGGRASTFSPSQSKEWIKTLEDFPQPIFYTTQPISTLVSDPTIKSNLETAVKDYFQESNTAVAAKKKELIQQSNPKIPSWCKQ